MAAFQIVDVFNDRAFRGNPLAVVDNEEGQLSDTQMKLIARQFNLSETTFVCSPSRHDSPIHLRSFLPNGREVFGIGHNILGVWWQLAASGKLDLSDTHVVSSTDDEETFAFGQQLGQEISQVFILRKKAPPTRRSSEISVLIRQSPPQLHDFHPDIASLATSVGLDSEDIGLVDAKELKPQVASTSTTRHLLVPVASLDALKRVRVDRDKLLYQLSLVDEKAFGMLFFARSAEGKGQFQARFWSPGMSSEDPATGSAAGPLSFYLYKHGELGLQEGVAKVEVTQGLQVGRECIIYVRLTQSDSGDAGKMSVDLLGSGARVAEGTIAVPDAETAF